MEYRIFGPVGVSDAGRPIKLAPQTRTVLAHLLLSPERRSPASVIEKNLWPGAKARSAVHQETSKLRRALTAAVVPQCQAGVYRLVVEDDEVDLFRFEDRLRRAATAATPQEKLRELGSALSECRLDPLGTIAGPWVEDWRNKLTGRMQLAVISYLETSIDVDGLSDALFECRRAIDRWPNSRLFHEFLLRSIHRHEGHAEFHAAFEECREKAGPAVRPELEILRRELMGDGGGGEAPTIVPHQLPAHRTAIFGRAFLLETVCQALSGDSVNGIVLLVGPAGVGKSTLGFRLAASLQDRFPDGVLYADLQGSSQQESTDVAQVLARFLADVGVTPGTPTADGLSSAYRSALARRSVLVVLDNARDAAQVLPLLPGPGRSAVVVTSRNAMDGLAATHAALQVSVPLLAADDCTALLTSIVGNLRVEGETEALQDIVRLCAGLPLAVIVVGARLRSRREMSLAEFLHEMNSADDPLATFVHEGADLNLAAALAPSYGSLSVPAAALFRRIGIHPGPTISRDAAIALMASRDHGIRGLDELRTAHLIDEVSYNRFAVHDLIRAYAGRKSVDAGGDDRRVTVERLLDHLLYTARDCDLVIAPGRDLPVGPSPAGPGHFVPADAGAAMSWFDADYDNILAAVDLAVREGLHTYAWLLPLTITPYQWRSNRYVDAQGSLQISLGAAEIAGRPQDRAMILRLLAGTDRALGRLDLAKVRLATAIELSVADEDTLGLAHGCHALAVLHRGTGDLDHAEERFLAALGTYRRLGDVMGEASSLNGLGCVSSDRGLYDDAARSCEEALALIRTTTDANGQADMLASLAGIRAAQGMSRTAIEKYNAAVEIYQALDYPQREAETLQRLADVMHQVGDRTQEREALSRALRLFRDLDFPEAEAVAQRLAALK